MCHTHLSWVYRTCSTCPPPLHRHFLLTVEKNRLGSQGEREGGSEKGRKEGTCPKLDSSSSGQVDAELSATLLLNPQQHAPCNRETFSMGGDGRAVEASRNSSGVRFSCTRGSKPKSLSFPRSGQYCTGSSSGRCPHQPACWGHSANRTWGRRRGRDRNPAFKWAVDHKNNEEPSIPQEVVGVSMGFAGSTSGYPLLVLTSKSHGHPESQFLVH